ncbi:MAG: SLC13 family permease [Phycisphaerales bacterium]
MQDLHEGHDDRMTWPRLATVALGPVLAVIAYLVLGSLTNLADAPRIVAGVGVWMGVWWITEAAPLEITGLLPLVMFPILGVCKVDTAAAPYANFLIFLLLGGTPLAAAMERWNLHTRLALGLMSVVGARPAGLVGGFLAVSALISMWVSNTATTAMLLPVTISVVAVVDARARMADRERKEFGAALLLAITYGASIGGVGTLVGTPPTAQLAAHLRGNLHVPITFLGWMKIGLPMLAIFVPVAWFVLTRVAFRISGGEVPGVREVIRAERSKLGPMRAAERRTLAVFLLTAAAWVGGQWIGVNDAVIAMAAVVVLALIPSGGVGSEPILTWKTASKAPWGIWLLFGGGLSLADGIDKSGLAGAVASSGDSLAGHGVLVVLVAISAAAVVLTEFSNNTALVAIGIPIVSAIAKALGLPPTLLLITLTLSASLGFMLPAGTAGNALVFQTGRVSVRQMMKAGLILDVLSAFLIPVLVYGAWKAGFIPEAAP